MKYSIIDKISNVLALSAKNDKHSYDYSWNADSVTERFIQVSNQLSGEEYLGWQLCFDEDGHYHSSAFSKEGVMITKEDIEWIFYDYAAVSGSDQNLFTDKFHGSGILYYLSSSSVPNSRMKKRLLKERIDYFKDVLSALKESKAAVRIIASPEGSGKGIIFFSLPEKMTLRMKTILSFAFTDMTPVEADSEAIIPASAMVSSDRLSIVLQGLLEAFYYERPVEKATENPDVDEHTSDTEIYIADDSDDIPETKSASITIDESSSIDELELSVRSFNCLKRAGVETVGQLRLMTEDDLRRIRNLSRKCVDEIIAKLKEYKPVCSSVTKPTLTYMEMLDELIGLKNVKEQVGKIVALAKMKKDMDSDNVGQGTGVIRNVHLATDALDYVHDADKRWFVVRSSFNRGEKAYDFLLKKTDGSKYLPGSGFKLYDAATKGNMITVNKDTTGYYVDPSADVEIMVDSADGVNVRGLAPGKYYLEETTTPDGYNTLTERKEVVITAGQTSAHEVIVVNNAGAELPSTGGRGTTILYAIGAALVIGAAVLLIARRRTEQ